jgi:neutral ceramidase
MNQNTFRFASLIVLVAWLLISSAASSAAEPGWQAGTAKVNITPQQEMWMAGYASRDRPATGTLADLWAKALVLQDRDGKRGLLLTLDLVGIDRSLSQAICTEISEQLGLNRQDIAVCTSHTHTGPVVGMNLASMQYRLLSETHQQQVDRYATWLQQNLLEIAKRALDDLQPCQLQHGQSTASFAVNRRNNPADQVPERRTAGQLIGPVDHDVPVLAVRNADGQLKAIVFGYACHATVLSSFQWSGDYPGFAQIELEQLHPGCQAMFWAGCGADQNPLPRSTDELARHYGRSLAVAVDSVLLTSKMSEVDSQLQTSYAEIDVEFAALPSRDDLELATKSTNRHEQSRAQMLLEQIDAGQPLSPTYPYPIGVWKLGEVGLVFLGGEVVVDYSLRLKQEINRPLWVAGYANDVMAYIPSRRVLGEGGYEGATAMVYYGLPTSWSPTIENAIVTEVIRQAQ